ncbi:MAG TPA: thioredoxin domain-containing protein [Candidatus Angelobacter sp.]|nr:thioredoxin domain-containing protein [Candidatus Angelobacter sp.]
MIRLRNVIAGILTALVFACVCSAAASSILQSPSGQGADGSILKTPPGQKVAIEVFEDLECPDCARWYPYYWGIAEAHHVPVVLHDFPLPMHPWSFQAAVFARFFDTKSQKLGEDFRGYIYKNQPNINKGNLQQWVQKFADDNKVPLPFNIDPDGKLKALVEADRELGTRAKLQHTPTIIVVGHGGPPSPFIEIQEVSDMNQNTNLLNQAIDQMEKKAEPVSAPKATHSKAPHSKKRASSKHS